MGDGAHDHKPSGTRSGPAPRTWAGLRGAWPKVRRRGGAVKRSDLLRGVVVTGEVCGTDLSNPAAEVMVRELEQYPIDAVVSALKRCRREVTGRLSLATIIARIDDGHPGAEEAWA